MIVDKIENIGWYEQISPNMKEAIDFIKSKDLSKLPMGKTNVSKNVFCKKESYTTKDYRKAQYEAHKNYIDIQIVLEGREKMASAPIDDFTENTEYDSHRDIVFGAASFTRETLSRVENGMFVVFTPEDAHKPGVSIERYEPSHVTKVIFKVKVAK